MQDHFFVDKIGQKNWQEMGKSKRMNERRGADLLGA